MAFPKGETRCPAHGTVGVMGCERCLNAWRNLQQTECRETMTSKKGNLTYAHVDGYDDVWVWAIVTDYSGCQDYGTVRMAFHDNELPTIADVRVILDALDV